ncbi:acylphosphatase [Rhizobium sp. BK275]|uniref:acylphosphatase n=1 Tax=Rhizobium sp. BK275 TaxID=2587077 RepID=UPI00161B8359|nr:acylphosphatase [Rhizobium sp. BK275]MBB3387377.1 acylphosphatase [Rhizobium sp. BK275]
MTVTLDAFRVRITGGVQGVGYRVWTRGQALQLGLTGWVRNEADGSVSALIIGSQGATGSMLERFWSGPAGSSVSDVKAEAANLDEVPDDFRIVR